jgi:hypothetical protein
VAGSCEDGDEPSGSIKCGGFPDQLSVLLASQEGLCCMELVISEGVSEVGLEDTAQMAETRNIY